MKTLKVGAASLNQVPMDWAGNKHRISKAIKKAQKEKVDLLCLPELCVTGYGCEDMFHSPHIQQKALSILGPLSKRVGRNLNVVVGIPYNYKGCLYNCAVVLGNHKILGIVPKQNLAQDGVHYEPRWFKAWERGKVVQEKVHFKFGPKTIPFGDLIFENTDGIRFGLEICEDAWVAERKGADLARRGVDIILNPSASHFAFRKHEIRKQLVTEGSRAFGCAYVYANMVGNESGKIIYDGATLIATNGTLIREGHRFSYQDVELTAADIDIDLLRANKTEREGFSGHAEGTDIKVLGTVKNRPAIISDPLDEANNSYTKEEEFEEAICLGLYDYLRKSGVKGYTVSLSGGADSSAVAILVASMIKKVKEALSPDEIKEETGIEASEFTVENLLTTAYQATQNSSDTTREAAYEVAKDIGSKHLHLEVGALVEAYKKELGSALGIDWNWDQHDITLQNIQARVRSPSIWMIANVENKILLATSNRSEASCGYATIDGDTAGGLSPISGIDKVFLRNWLVHKEKDFPSLAKVNAQQPTAELRPSEEGQTDEDDLMPYDVLNTIENLAILEKRSPLEVFQYLREDPALKAHDENDLRAWTILFFQLWCRNQWKRERYAPGFFVDDKSVDPKSWCRFPILSSGYREELESLQKQ